MHRVFAVVACAAAFHLHAQPIEPPRPKVGLVLSGGGARGLAHIGVLKALREHARAGRLHRRHQHGLDRGRRLRGRPRRRSRWRRWSATPTGRTIFSDRPPREDLSFRRKEDDLRFIGKTELGLKRDGVVLPRGALGSQNLEEFLRGISRHASEAAT